MQLAAILGVFAFSAWFFGVTPDEVGDFFKGVSTSHRPAMPIEVQYRPSMFGNGYVAMLKNTSDGEFTYQVELRSTNLDAPKKSMPITIPAGSSTEIGWAEGWKFERGDTITVTHADYASGIYSIPYEDS